MSCRSSIAIRGTTIYETFALGTDCALLGMVCPARMDSRSLAVMRARRQREELQHERLPSPQKYARRTVKLHSAKRCI